MTTMSVAIRMDASGARPDDVCVVCKSTVQTSPNLRFKVGARCYHRICEGCVDRKFSAGKANCPVVGCPQMHWKRDWTTQTFEDVEIVREIDIRKRVWRILDLSHLRLTEDPSSGWEGVFEDLRSYNDYLELKEEFAMNLIYRTDEAGTNRKLREYEVANGLRKEKDEGKKPAAVVVHKDGDYPDASGLIKGLKKRYVPAPRSPYQPFGDVPDGRGYYSQYDNYTMTPLYSKNLLEECKISGFDVQDYMDEALLRAFSGLGVFVGSEKDGKADEGIPVAIGAM